MTITVDELMEHAFVLTVNQARLDAFLARWDTYGLKRPRPFWGFHMRIGDYREVKVNICNCYTNCSLSHYAMVKMAESQDWPFIFILEDDALPCRHIREKLPKALENLPDDLDVLRLGYLDDKPGTFTLPGPLLRVHVGGAHAYIVFKRYYKEYERIFNNENNIVTDQLLLNHHAHIQGETCRIFLSSPNLFTQYEPLNGYHCITHPRILAKVLQIQLKEDPDFDIRPINVPCT